MLVWTNSGLPGVDVLRDRGVNAHLLRGGVGHFDIHVLLPGVREGEWDAYGTGASSPGHGFGCESERIPPFCLGLAGQEGHLIGWSLARASAAPTRISTPVVASGQLAGSAALEDQPIVSLTV